MLHGQILILHLFRLLLRLQERLFHILAETGLPRAGTGNPGHTAQGILQRPAESLHGKAAAGKQLGNQILRILGEGGQKMLLLHIHMAVFHGKRRSPLQRGQGLLRQLIHVHLIHLRKVCFDLL